jgi:hypothetical protein
VNHGYKRTQFQSDSNRLVLGLCCFMLRGLKMKIKRDYVGLYQEVLRKLHVCTPLEKDELKKLLNYYYNKMN